VKKIIVGNPNTGKSSYLKNEGLNLYNQKHVTIVSGKMEYTSVYNNANLVEFDFNESKNDDYVSNFSEEINNILDSLDDFKILIVDDISKFKKVSGFKESLDNIREKFISDKRVNIVFLSDKFQDSFNAKQEKAMYSKYSALIRTVLNRFTKKHAVTIDVDLFNKSADAKLLYDKK
jgi:hypothetical protein